MADQPTETEALRELEESLWRAETRYDVAYLERVFHPQFFEFGQSGRVWTREESMAADPAEFGEIVVELPLPEFDVAEVGPGVALVHYVSRTDYGNHRRSSLWLHTDDDGWRLRFHQGTPIPDQPGAAPTAGAGHVLP